MAYIALLVKVFTIQLFKLTLYNECTKSIEQSQHFNATIIIHTSLLAIQCITLSMMQQRESMGSFKSETDTIINV